MKILDGPFNDGAVPTQIGAPYLPKLWNEAQAGNDNNKRTKYDRQISNGQANLLSAVESNQSAPDSNQQSGYQQKWPGKRANSDVKDCLIVCLWHVARSESLRVDIFSGDMTARQIVPRG
jgi:hypothetical protein